MQINKIIYRIKGLSALLPGLALTASIAVCAMIAARFMPHLGGTSSAIILGLIIGNIIPPAKAIISGVRFSEKEILTCAIVLMGFHLNLMELGSMGASIFYVVLPMMLITICASVFIGRMFGYSKDFSLLMGTGNAVCGSSAIAAVAPVLKADEEEIGISIGIVNLLGTAGIFAMPLAAGLLKLSEQQSSFAIGGSLQAVGQVVAAGFSLNDSIGESATLIKMLRVLMIGPVVMGISLMLRRGGEKRGSGKYIPGYIIGFVLCSVLGSVFSEQTAAISFLNHTSKLLLTVAMAAIGMKIRFTSLLRHGPKALLFGWSVAMVQAVYILTVVLLFM